MTDDLTQALRAIIEHLQQAGLDYMLVGSIAAMAYGRNRSTYDFDVVVEPDGDKLRQLIARLPDERFYASPEAAREALVHETQFNVIDMDSGWKADIIPRKRRPFSQAEFRRRHEVELLGSKFFVATVEDTIVAKLEWAAAGGGSQRQLEDVAELWRLAGDALDRAHVERWVARLDLGPMLTRALTLLPP